jgi:hypothetical protein
MRNQLKTCLGCSVVLILACETPGLLPASDGTNPRPDSGVPSSSSASSASSTGSSGAPTSHDGILTMLDAGVRDASSSDAATVSCVPLGEECEGVGPCCSGYCDAFSAYIYSTCREQVSVGEGCIAHEECTTGNCAWNICRLPAGSCSTDGRACAGSSDCCTGSCHYGPDGSGPGLCWTPQSNGAACQDGRSCASGDCHDGWCASSPLACAPAGEPCVSGETECCNGYCVWMTYTESVCHLAANPGEYCSEEEECFFKNCSGFLCRNEDCVEPQATCYQDADCCNGFCTYTGESYAPGECSSLLSSGTACSEDHWCQSGACIDGQC